MGRFVVTSRALLLLCGASLALIGAAAAEPAAPPPASAPSGVTDGLPPGRIVAIVRQNGFDPMSRPTRDGETYVLHALDPNDVEYRLVLDARTGRTVSMRAIAMPGPFQAVPYDGRNGPVFGRIFSGPADAGYPSQRPPRNVPHVKPDAKPAPQETAAAPPPSEHDAGAPLPRPRPYTMEATGSIPADAPKAVMPPKTPEAPAAQKTPGAPKDNGGAAMPPVAPLD